LSDGAMDEAELDEGWDASRFRRCDARLRDGVAVDRQLFFEVVEWADCERSRCSARDSASISPASLDGICSL
jgi:hypothetical protein